jgi:hypothetical protein
VRLLFVCALLASLACAASPITPNPDGADVPLSPPAPQFFLLGAGDIGACGSEGARQTALLLDQLEGTVFTAGDSAYPHGTLEDFQRCYEPTWGRHRWRTYATPGNHEYDVPGAPGYFAYFGEHAGPDTLGYYDFMLGNWHILSLNSNIAVRPGSAQVEWLRSRLAATPVRCTLAIWHHPLMSSGPNGDNLFMFDVFRVLYEAGADVVINGHDHLYERFAPRDLRDRPDSIRGIRQFTVGTGGGTLYPIREIRPNSEVRLSTHGIIRLVLREADYTWQFITPDGIADSGTGECH